MSDPIPATPRDALIATRAPKLGEIASRIAAHLVRMAAEETAAAGRGFTGKGRRFYEPNAWAAGSRVGIRYVSYQYTTPLTKADAWAYLQWLDAGNVGRHHILDRAIAAAGEVG